MTSARNAVSRLVGGVQCGLGALAAAFAYLIYASQPLRDSLLIGPQEIPLYMFVSLVFSMLSIVSGLLLMRGENSRS